MPPQSSNGTARPPVGRPFQPGKSGNPGGRPKGIAAKVREMAPAHELVRWYTAIWQRDEDELDALGVSLKDVTLAERNKAGEWLTERGYGKAPTHAPVTGDDPLELDTAGTAVKRAVDELASRRDASAAGGSAEAELDRASTA